MKEFFRSDNVRVGEGVMFKMSELDLEDPYTRNMVYFMEFLEKRKKRKKRGKSLHVQEECKS
ncbi:MAG: hypothetical protein N3E48_05285 [Candidatus Bathyarchaeota archaeon]|nr:hypothetical protein [Candidatus Bathyarchaeota archaeon]